MSTHETRKAAARALQAFLYDAVSGALADGNPIVTRERAERVVDSFVDHMIEVLKEMEVEDMNDVANGV